MKTVLYLIQASAGLPKIYECLKKRSYILLSYKEDTSDTTIYAPDTTFTGGRNRLYQYVKDNNLLYDYYVLMDEDAVFKKTKSILCPNISIFEYSAIRSAYSNVYPGSLRSKWPLRALFNHYSYQAEEQEAGFENFEESLKLGYPIVSMIYYTNRFGRDKGSDSYLALPKEDRKECLENANWDLQTVSWMDGIVNALSQEVFFANTVLPMTEKYDADSWWLSGFIFIIKANHYYPNQIIQNNQYAVLNTQASDYPNMAHVDYPQYHRIKIQIYTELCAELGVDKIQLSECKEVKAHLPLKQVEGRFMSRFGFFVKIMLLAIFYKYVIVKSRFYLKKMLCRK